MLPERGPGKAAGSVIVAHPALTVFDNSEQKIRRTVKRKRRQGRNVDTPAILTVHATGISSEFHDFDLALYGREAGFFDTHARRITKTEFQADGVFNKGSDEPTFAAMLAFVNVNLPGGPDPILYLHPRYRGQLPEALSSIERRSYDAEMEAVFAEPSRRAGFLRQLGFVSAYYSRFAHATALRSSARLFPNSLLNRRPSWVANRQNRRCLSAVRTRLLSLRSSCWLGGFIIEAVGERETLPTLAPEDGAFRAPGGQGTEENYPLPAHFADKNDAPRATSHAGPLRSFS